MRSESAIAALRDIAHHIDLALSFTEGFDYEAFVADPRTVYAVTRCLEIISEGSRRLPDDLKARHPSIAWRDMAGAGNIYRRDYEDSRWSGPATSGIDVADIARIEDFYMRAVGPLVRDRSRSSESSQGPFESRPLL